MGRQVADLDVALDRALAAIFEGDVDLHVSIARAVIERVDQGGVTLADEGTAHLVGARELAVVGLQRLGQDEEAADLGAGPAGIGGEVAVERLYLSLDEV